MNPDKSKTIFDSVPAKIAKMNKLKIAIALTFGALLLFGICVFLSINNAYLKHKLAQAEELVKNIQEENKRLDSEKNKILQENEKLQADSVSYLSLNSKLQEGKEKADKAVEETKKILEQKVEDLQKAQMSIKRLEESLSKVSKEREAKMQAELKKMQEKVKTLEETLNRERGLFHYNLAVSYTQAKLYDEAIESYKKSLSYNPNNAEANYNLGFLYANERSDPEMAAKFYKEYLRLKPDADDRDEVEVWIKQLEDEE